MSLKQGNFFVMQRGYASNMVFDDKEKWCEPRCWENLIELANFEKSTFPFKGRYYQIQRGQVATTLDALKRRWRWRNRSRVSSYLKKLELHQMISVCTESGFTLITIVNYDNYQFGSKERFEEKEIEHPIFDRTKADMEFQKLKKVYPDGRVDKRAAFKFFSETKLYESTEQIVGSIENWKACDDWQEGFAPKLSNFLKDELYTQQPPKGKTKTTKTRRKASNAEREKDLEDWMNEE